MKDFSEYMATELKFEGQVEGHWWWYEENTNLPSWRTPASQTKQRTQRHERYGILKSIM